MKDSKSILKVLVFFVFVVISFITCKRTDSKEDIKNENILNNPLAVNEINFTHPTKLPNSITKIDNKKIIYTKYGLNKTFAANYTILKNNDLRELVRNITNYNLEPIQFVIYFSKNINPYEFITNDIVTAFSFYTIKGGDCFHQLYIRNNGKYIIDTNFSIISNLRNANNSSFIINNILPKSLNSVSFISINNSDDYFANNSKQDFFLLKEAVHYLNWIKSNTMRKAPVPGGGTGGNSQKCGDAPGCEGGPFWTLCAPANHGMYSCGIEPPICERNETYLILVNSNSYDINDLNDAYCNLHYKLRDSVLYGSSVGDKYIRYFYAISNIVYQETDLAFAYKCFIALPEMNTIITKLLNPTGHENDVLLSTEFATELNSIMNDLRLISNNVDYISILDDLQNDIDYYTGKTLSQVLDVLYP